MQYPGSSPDILESSESSKDPEKSGPQPGQIGPRAVSRAAMVKAVVEQEDLEIEKPVKNVCLVDTPQIFPATTSMTTRAVIESTASSAEYVAPNHPKGINRMSRKHFSFPEHLIFSRFLSFRHFSGKNAKKMQEKSEVFKCRKNQQYVPRKIFGKISSRFTFGAKIQTS